MLRTCEQFDGTHAVVPVLHRNLMIEAHARRRLRIASNRTQGGPLALPLVTGVITKMTVTHCVSPGLHGKSLVPQLSDQRLPDRPKKALDVSERIFQDLSPPPYKALAAPPRLPSNPAAGLAC